MRAFYLHRRRTKDSKRNVYYVQFADASGHRGTAMSTGCTTRADAERWAQQRVKRTDRPGQQPTLEDFARDFFDWSTSAWIRRQHAKGRRFSELVAQSRQGHLDHYILPRFGKTRIVDLDQKSIEDWLATLPLSNQTRNHMLVSFRIVLREAKLAGIIDHNILADAEPFGAAPKRRDVFTLAELHALFPDDDDKLVAIWGEPERAVAFLLLASTGIRSGECRALRWLNWIAEGALYVDCGLDSFNRLKGTKTGASRVVLLPAKAQRALTEWKRLAEWKAPEDFVFSEGQGQPHSRNWLTRTLPAAMARANVTADGRYLVVHSLRHGFVTMMQNFASKEITRAMSGHATEKVFASYSHPSAADLLARLEPARDAVEKIWTQPAKDKSQNLTPSGGAS